MCCDSKAQAYNNTQAVITAHNSKQKKNNSILKIKFILKKIKKKSLNLLFKFCGWSVNNTQGDNITQGQSTTFS